MKNSCFAKAIICMLMAFVMHTAAFSQGNKTGGWDIVNVNYHVSKKASLFLDVQTKSQNMVNNFYYHELKLMALYNLTDKIVVATGFGDFKTYTSPGNFKSPVKTNEWRIWEQINFRNNLGRFSFQNRIRLQQRWINQVYRNRFSYRLNTVVPINHKKVNPHTLYINAFDEIFFNNRQPYYEMNRWFGGVGYQALDWFAFQTGFVKQNNYHKPSNQFIQTSLLFTINQITPHKRVQTILN